MGLSPIKEGSNTSETKCTEHDMNKTNFKAYQTRYRPSSLVSLTVVYPLKRDVGRIESPLSIVLHSLGVRKFFCKERAARPRCQKRSGLKSHHRPGEEAQCAGVHLEPLENIWGVEEPYHGDPVKETSSVS